MNWLKCDHSDVWEQSLQRWKDLDARVSRLETSEAIFRDKVLRKIQREKEEEPKKPQDLYGGMLLPEP